MIGFGQIVEIRDNYFSYIDENHGLTSLGKMQFKAFQKMTKYAKERNKVLSVISVTKKGKGHASFTSKPFIEIIFRLANDSTEYFYYKKIDETPVDPSTQKDMYDELIKLEDLRQKGIITQYDFNIQRHRILSESSYYPR